MVLTKFWEQNKRFLLITGSGLLVFLILNSVVGAYIARADKMLDKASQLTRKIRALKKELDHGYAEQFNRLSNYQEHEEALLEQLVLPPMKEVDSFDTGAPRVQFNRAIDRVWGTALEKGNRMGATIPEKLGPENFGIDRGDTIENYRRYYRELAVTGIALNALVEAGVAQIGRPQLMEYDDVPILGSEGSLCRFRGASFKVAGTYESFVRLLKSVQDPSHFLQVRVLQLRPMKRNERFVEGVFDFAGLYLVDELEEEGGESL